MYRIVFDLRKSKSLFNNISNFNHCPYKDVIGHMVKIVAIPAVNTVSIRPVTDLMEAVWLDVTVVILDINVIKVYFLGDIFFSKKSFMLMCSVYIE